MLLCAGWIIDIFIIIMFHYFLSLGLGDVAILWDAIQLHQHVTMVV